MHLVFKYLDKKIVQFVLLIFVSIIHMNVTPFTKVEESFQLQAAHDFLKIGYPRFYHCLFSTLVTGQLYYDYKKCWNNIENLKEEQKNSFFYKNLLKPKAISYKKWDHEEFPGAVPRTFIPSFLISLICIPTKLFTETDVFFQAFIRLNLASFVMFSMVNLVDGVKERFGKYTSGIFVILTCTQFHFMFYSSRTLPNTFALVLVISAYGFWLRKKYYSLVLISIFCIFIFRFETSIILGTIVLIEVIKGKIDFFVLVIVGCVFTLIAILTTVLFDSIFWGRLIYPEFESMYFNIYLNKSHLWGTQPFYWYILVAIPKILLISLPFAYYPTRKCFKRFYLPIFIYIFVHSFLPHKELRFIMYIIPLLNISIADKIASLYGIHEITEETKRTDSTDDFNQLYDFKDLSSYKTFTKDELKELQKIRFYNYKKDNSLRKRKTGVDKPKNISYEESCFVNDKKELFRKTYEYLKNYQLENLRKKTDFELDEFFCEKDEKMLQNLIKENQEKIETDESKKNLKKNDKFFLKFTKRKIRFGGEKNYTTSYMIKNILVILHFSMNFAITAFFLFVSFYNYPGGDAVTWLNDNLPKHMNQFNLNRTEIAVHVGNLAAQTGFTRFSEWDYITYDKSPDFLPLTKSDSNLMIEKLKIENNITETQSLFINLTKFKLVYLLLDDLKPDFLDRYCQKVLVRNNMPKLPYDVDKLECNFNELKNCRVNSVVYGYHSYNSFSNLSDIKIDIIVDENGKYIAINKSLWIVNDKLELSEIQLK